MVNSEPMMWEGEFDVTEGELNRDMSSNSSINENGK